jgi:hypothetical protein
MVMIFASFNVNKEDVLALRWHYYSSSPTVRKTRVWGQLTIPLVMVLLAFSNVYHAPGHHAPAIILLVLAAVWALFYPRYYNWYLLRKAEKMFKETSYQKAFGAYKITLDEDGIISASPVGESKHSWSAVHRVLLTAHHLLIFLAGPQGYTIPRIQVPDTTIQDMKAFAEKRIQGTESGALPVK